MKIFNSHRGSTLVELMTAMAIFSLIISVIFTLYATMLKTSASTRKIAKVEGEITNTVWPLFKEIESAGFGVNANGFGGSCSPEINYTGGILTINSTTTGTQAIGQTSPGTWSFIGTGCSVSGFNNGDPVSIISPTDKSNLGTATVAAGALGACNATSWPGNIAYLSPSLASACYNTSYTLSPSTKAPNSTAQPATCASGTNQLWRSSVAVGSSASYQPMLDCVLAFSAIFGCIDTTGNLTWQTGNTCPLLNSNGNYNPRFVRIGLVEQDSNQNEYVGTTSQPNIILFSDTTTLTQYTVSLTGTLGAYRWRTIERTISLRNLE